jgi:hypothetical protein
MEVLILVLPAKHADDDDDVYLCLGLWWADRQAKKVLTSYVTFLVKLIIHVKFAGTGL